MKHPMHEVDENGHRLNSPGAITTWSGLFVDPLDMAPEDVAISDIAHALARQCRFNGHCDGYISVARHSIWVARELSPELQLWGLLHDAAEAYLGDMPHPLKHSDTMTTFREAEDRLEQVIAKRFDLPWPMPDAVHEADRKVLVEYEMPWACQTYFGNYQRDESDYLDWFRLLTREASAAA